MSDVQKPYISMHTFIAKTVKFNLATTLFIRPPHYVSNDSQILLKCTAQPQYIPQFSGQLKNKCSYILRFFV